MNNKSIVLSVAVFGLILLSVAAWFFVRPMFMRAAIPTEQTLAVLRPHSPIIGPEDAPVTIVEFFDPTCEACRKIYPVVRDIMAEYGDTVRLAIRYVAGPGGKGRPRPPGEAPRPSQEAQERLMRPQW